MRPVREVLPDLQEQSRINSGFSGSVEIILISILKFLRVTPSLPQRGKQPKGASPLDPHFLLNFFKWIRSMSCSTGRTTTRRRAPVAASQPLVSGLLDFLMKIEFFQIKK
jgi:hypothetical protein